MQSGLSSGQTLGVKAQRFRGHTSPHRNVKEKKNQIQVLNAVYASILASPCAGFLFLFSIGNEFMGLFSNWQTIGHPVVCNWICSSEKYAHRSMKLKQYVYMYSRCYQPLQHAL
eukprot:TRINITY_DN12390_c0_g2_i2.p4 TRINITY_DN12390_c0_g2~~TRINITY_DN12390_c0_g2_i2.p4  ORF type:complete len:114 (+),score=14.08 TRINITY_DN12390_c0_g2_i2:33-374(+)